MIVRLIIIIIITKRVVESQDDRNPNVAVTFAPCDKLDEIFMSASSFISEDAKLNFWRRLTTVQLDSKENDDNFANNFVNVLERLKNSRRLKRY